MLSGHHTDGWADPQPGQTELAAAVAQGRSGLIAAVVFSTVANILMLAAPLYMLQVYDRVLVSRSEETLVALTLLLGLLFVIMGLLDLARHRVMARLGARLLVALDGRVLGAALRRLSIAPGDAAALSAQTDLDAMVRLRASPVLLCLFDAPWSLVFALTIFAFHPLLGLLSVAGAAALVAIGWTNQARAEGSLRRATLAAHGADRCGHSLTGEAEVIRALGMSGAAFSRWQALRHRAQSANHCANETNGNFAVFSRTVRLALQSALLGLGAFLVLRGELSAGAMIATSILMGRALQPLEQTVAHWPVISRALQARNRLAMLLAQVPVQLARTPLPRPEARLEVQGLTLVPPGSAPPVLRGVSFTLRPGQALGVIGPSGAGKTALARALTGVWPVNAGSIRLGGAPLDQYDSDVLGALIGYLPQRVTLFDGTIAENIARLQSDADPAQIVAAAQKAAAHDMILRLPEGYDTAVASAAARLSGGQIQRIGLARALYGNPVLLVLDEPNSSLDNDGSLALNLALRAAKAAGAAVLVMAHRPAALQECDLLMVLREGTVAAFGPRDDVLRDMLRNADDITRSAASGSGAKWGGTT